MTVLVWRDGIFAADSQVTAGGYAAGFDQKVYTKLFGKMRTWAGGAGDSVKIQQFLAVYQGAKRLEEVAQGWKDYEGKKDEGKTSAIIIFDEVRPTFGRKYWAFYDASWPYSEQFFRDYMAWGSGDELALGALYMGASACDAVHAACRFDTGCGLPLQFIGTDGKFHVV